MALYYYTFILSNEDNTILYKSITKVCYLYHYNQFMVFTSLCYLPVKIKLNQFMLSTEDNTYNPMLQ